MNNDTGHTHKKSELFCVSYVFVCCSRVFLRFVCVCVCVCACFFVTVNNNKRDREEVYRPVFYKGGGGEKKRKDPCVLLLRLLTVTYLSLPTWTGW